jgi:hypothetical protein
MNSVIEFHDSKVSGITYEGDNIIVRFISAYIHKSEGTPAYDSGTGWVQPAELIIGAGSLEGTRPDFPCRIADGKLECEGTVLDNILPLPFECKSRIKLELIFTTDSMVTLVGENAVLHLQGEAKFIEDYQ